MAIHKVLILLFLEKRMILVDWEQIVEVKYNNNSKKHYIKKGYISPDDTHVPLLVKLKDVLPGSRIKIKVVCDYCNNEFTADLLNITRSRKTSDKDCCNNCKIIKRGETRRKNEFDKIYDKALNFAMQKGYTILSTFNDYINNKSIIKFICPKHGECETTWHRFANIHNGCQKCGKESAINKQKTEAKNNFKKYVEQVGGKWLNPCDYIDAKTSNLLFQCECGNTYTTSSSNYRFHKMVRCLECSKKISSAELRIKNFLEEYNVKYHYQKRFTDCKDKKTLPFDFYLPDYNMCIEYDGQQHENPTFGDESLQNTIIHDKIKNDYCKNNNINLLRINWRDEDNIEQILEKELKLCERNSLVS